MCYNVISQLLYVSIYLIWWTMTFSRIILSPRNWLLAACIRTEVIAVCHVKPPMQFYRQSQSAWSPEAQCIVSCNFESTGSRQYAISSSVTKTVVLRDRQWADSHGNVIYHRGLPLLLWFCLSCNLHISLNISWFIVILVAPSRWTSVDWVRQMSTCSIWWILLLNYGFVQLIL